MRVGIKNKTTHTQSFRINSLVFNLKNNRHRQKPEKVTKQAVGKTSTK